jgi:glyoxylase-like metal-dependent hydrolase (beta-lactamase superfamily II)/rhodanese-related sulfurtransferase
MHFKQFYLGCLAHASYLIGSKGEAAVVDPQRDVDQYLQEAAEQGLQIKHIIETHLHADFVSGHLEIARRTGAKIYFGAAANAQFEHVPVKEGDEIAVGDVKLKILETPGHTPESISVLVFDPAQPEIPDAVLTGDTLFIGDVGRPDLLGARMPAGQLAGMLYDSLHQKLLALPDSVKVYPAHGAGSMCGRNISKETSCTIGRQRQFNYALQPMSRDDFISMMTTDLPEAPLYFGEDARINREGPAILEELPPAVPLSPAEILNLQREGAMILDTRPSDQYTTSHIPGSLNIGLGGQFASWAGTLIPLNTPIAIVAENSERAAEARLRLSRVGHENIAGYLESGLLAWHEAGLPMASIEQIAVDELDRRLSEQAAGQVVDVRRPGEWKCGHIAQAQHLPLNRLRETIDNLDRNKQVTVICAGGYRSCMAASILEQEGFLRITNVAGGMTAWANANLPQVS